MEKTQKRVVVDFIKAFSCAYSVTKNLSQELGVEIDPMLLRSVVGFSSGISTMGDTFFHGLLKSDRIFEDERRFRPAKLFDGCKRLYQTIEREFGSAHCQEILGVKLAEPGGFEKYQREKKIDLCRKIAKTVVKQVREQP